MTFLMIIWPNLAVELSFFLSCSYINAFFAFVIPGSTTALKCFYCNAARYWEGLGYKLLDECNEHTTTVIGCEVCYKFRTGKSDGAYRDLLGCTGRAVAPGIHHYFKGIFNDPAATMKVCSEDMCNSTGKPTTSVNAIFLALVSGIFFIFSVWFLNIFRSTT